MKLLVGAYSQITNAEPMPVYERALEAVCKPLLTHIHAREDAIMQLSLSIPLLVWLDANHGSVSLLISELAKNGKLEMLTGSFNQSILSLLAPKDRSNQIEMTTTYLRKRFGQRSKTLFSYGQVFNPLYINTANLCFIDSIIISTSDETGLQQFDEPFIMQEMGKSVSIIPMDGTISDLIASFAKKTISFGNLIEHIRNYLESEPPFVMAMINLDHLLQAGVTAQQTIQLFDLFFGYETSSIEEAYLHNDPPKKGYLQAGWYGIDANKGDLGCINELFVKDESLAYLYGRYTTMVETARMYKKDKDVRKRLEALIQKISCGSMYLCDANAPMLRSSVRKLFWRYISEADSVLTALKDYSYPVNNDFDHDALSEYLFFGKYLSCVVDPKGGSLSELTYLPSLYNYGDTFSPLSQFGSSSGNQHQLPPGQKQRLFSDVFLREHFVMDEYTKLDEKNCLAMGSQVYDLEGVDRRNTEYVATCTTGDSPIIGGSLQIAKHFKLRQNTILVDITLTNIGEEQISCIYGCEIPLSIDSHGLPISFIQLENKKNVTWQEKEVVLEQVKSLRIYDEPNSTSLTLVGDSRFTLLKEDYTIESETVLGNETLYQHTLFMASWPIVLASGGEKKITLGLRVERK
ncbi:MAG: alpha-amylase/4-alpha-glucanotransferase domain-containing protein [Sphaerochaeta sp.]|jgi:ribosomal protein S15P/S13E|uniref:alpha-amylase/4-alpha-glucanotransferase domain-containing protein n=1 Tax=Sphaerochaeta sp. TaxID=1972642 RepID=UPI003D13B389